MASQTNERVGGSYGSFGKTNKKEKNKRTCSSQPFIKPAMSFYKKTECLMGKVLKFLIRNISLLTKVDDDSSCQEERQDFIIQCPEELNQSTQTEQDSVSPGDEVCSVIQDLESQWKRGKLPNMLPVMDFIIWTVLQEKTQEGSIAKQCLRKIKRCRSKVHFVSFNILPDSV
ncbi:hypothetical protein UPYG_G00159290 [Umbra pygmaea]|uniref:Uncharacterized protein n=1 Tax=Umbra pygmaea TaxID=75934 RepID=A0ABD0WYW2_UMBPY